MLSISSFPHEPQTSMVYKGNSIGYYKTLSQNLNEHKYDRGKLACVYCIHIKNYPIYREICTESLYNHLKLKLTQTTPGILFPFCQQNFVNFSNIQIHQHILKHIFVFFFT